jgi:uncharacterized protein YjbJ (UPF0337 family)
MIDVDRQRLTHDWSKLKGQVKEQWGKLTDDDLLAVAGRREQLLAKIRQHYHVAAEEAERQVRDWEEKIGLGSPGND